MEQKLKKQRRRLILRVTLILAAVWLSISVTYCLVRLHSEKSDMRSQTFSNLSYAKQMLSVSELSSPSSSHVYLNHSNLLYFKDMVEENPHTQLVIVDPESKTVIADTANKIIVRFSFGTEMGTYPDAYGYIDYSDIRRRLSDSLFRRVCALLKTDGSDGGSYELVCTRFFVENEAFIPLELSVALVPDADGRFDQCRIIERFPLDGRVPDGTTVYSNSEYRINLIPKEFFLSEGYGNDYIGSIPPASREKNIEVIRQKGLEYIFYTSEYYFLDAFIYSEETKTYENMPKLYILQYAKKANLLEGCAVDLICGVAIVFGFFFVIGFIICFMIWNTVRAQIIQEQKRLDFTNALAHDIKTPLFVISGYAYSLKENIDSDDRESYLDKIISQTEQINGLVHKMLNLSKLDSAGMTLNRSEFDAVALMTEILDDFKKLSDARTIAFSHDGECVVSADRELIRAALQNLIENAVKYSPPGSEILVDMSDKSLSISNPSEPLSKAELKKIWQPYYRADKSRQQKGNGLGLSIVRSILDLHGMKYEMSMKDGRMVFHTTF